MSGESTKLPEDRMNHPIPVLQPSTPDNLAIGAATDRVAIPSGAEVIRLRSNVECWVNFGDVTIEASNTTAMAFDGGSEYFKVGNATYIAVIQGSEGTGSLNIVKMI